MDYTNPIAEPMQWGSNSLLNKRGNLEVTPQERKEIDKTFNFEDFNLLDCARSYAEPGYRSKSQEVAEEYMVRNGVRSQQGVFQMPTNVSSRALRDQNTTDDGDLVATDHLASSFISVLQSNSILVAAGAQSIGNLVGNVDIPSQEGSTDAYWVDEGQAATLTNASFGSRKAEPHTLGAYVDLTRRILIQSDPSVDMLVRNSLSDSLRLGLEAALLASADVALAPKSIMTNADIASVSIDASSPWGGLIDCQTACESNNGVFKAWICSPNTYGKMLTASKVTGEAEMVANVSQGQRSLAGYPVFTTTQIADDVFLAGDFSQIMLCLWSGIDLMSDPFSLGVSGGLRLSAFQDSDCIIRRPEALVKGVLA